MSEEKKTEKKSFMSKYGYVVIAGAMGIIFFVCMETVFPFILQNSIETGEYLATETILPDILMFILAPLNYGMEHPLLGIPAAIALLIAVEQYEEKVSEERKMMREFTDFISIVIKLYIFCTIIYQILI